MEHLALIVIWGWAVLPGVDAHCCSTSSSSPPLSKCLVGAPLWSTVQHTGERHLMLFDSQLTGKMNWSGQRSTSFCAGWSFEQASSCEGGSMRVA